MNDSVVGEDQLSMFGGEDPGPVLVGDENGVEIGQQADRRRGVGGRSRRIRNIEQFHTRLVTEGSQSRAQVRKHRAQTGEPGPRLRIAHPGRTVRCQVAANHLCHIGLGLRSVQAFFHARAPRSADTATQATRGHLNQRHLGPHRERQRPGVHTWPALLQSGADLTAGQWLPFHQCPANLATSTRSTPASALPWGLAGVIPRPSTGCSTGRSARQSAALTR